jgi:NTE family protein
MAALLATVLTRRPAPLTGALPDWEEVVAGPVREFTAADRRTGPILKRLLPWNWFRKSTGVEALASEYHAHLTDLRLVQLPAQPNFVLCATDMVFGVNWIFERDRTGDFRAGYMTPPPADWPLARAVAASSCFPPVFNPLPLSLDPIAVRGGTFPAGPQRDALVGRMQLTDGGDYDNLGLEPVWKSHSVGSCFRRRCTI